MYIWIWGDGHLPFVQTRYKHKYGVVEWERKRVRVKGAPSSFLLLVAMPFAPSSVLAPSSKARSP